MDGVATIDDAALLIEDERIAWFGPRQSAPGGHHDHVVDAAGGCVVPGLVDCHTHVVFAGSRVDEFVQRIRGRTYLEILEAGGGIHVTVAAVRAADEDELVRLALPRLLRMLASGSTTVEVKSGYGLTPADELKTLRAVKRLAGMQHVELIGTYMAAHTVPKEHAGRPDAYLDVVLEDRLLETLYSSDLAEFADVFCERGAFDLKRSERFLRECGRHGLKPKIHAEQITNSGSARLAASLGAVSADHLEQIDDAGIRALAASPTIPVLLPGCTFFLNGEPAPARKLIEADLPVAIASDCNPGSSMIESMPLIVAIAVARLRLTPIEALVAATANAAAALDRGDRLGAIEVGHQADLLVLHERTAAHMAYEVGRNPVRLVIKRGRVVHENVM